MPYQKSTNNNEVTFDVQPEPYINPGGGAVKYTTGCLMIPGAIIFLGMAYDAESIIWKLILVAIAAAFLYVPYRLGKTPKAVEETRIPKRFTVNAEGVTIDGKTYRKDDIQFISVWNGMLNLPGNYVPRGHEGIANAQQFQTAQAAKVNYWVVMETNGVPVYLGVGLTDIAAKAVVKDVSNILGLTVS